MDNTDLHWTGTLRQLPVAGNETNKVKIKALGLVGAGRGQTSDLTTTAAGGPPSLFLRAHQ